MVFPIESEDRTMRNLLMVCRENMRILVESFRKTLGLVDGLTKDVKQNSGDPATELQRLNEEASRTQENLHKSLNEVGGILSSRDDLYRLAAAFSDAMDIMGSLNMRLLEVKKRGWKLKPDEAKSLSTMTDKTFDAYLKLRDSLTSLGFNSEKAMGFAKEVDELERELDLIYVRADMEIAVSGADLPTILILREVIRDMEALMNKGREIAGLIRILAV